MEATMILATRYAFLCLLLALPAMAQAKGIFQAQGQVAEVRRDGDTLTFRFRGWISAGYASAPDEDSRRRWHDIRWDSVDVPITLRDWTVKHESGKADPSPSIDATREQLDAAARSGRKASFSLDNPAFFLTNRGQLAKVAGTYIYLGYTDGK
jgi:hypothetical protein